MIEFKTKVYSTLEITCFMPQIKVSKATDISKIVLSCSIYECVEYEKM